MIKDNICDEISKREDGNFDVRINTSWGVVSQSAEIIVPVKYANRLPLQFANTIVESSYSHYKGVIDDKGKEMIPTIHEHLFSLGDLYIFGYGGHEEKEYNFFNNIRDAHWGCITMDGKIIIPPHYECIKIKEDFIIAGKNGHMTGDFDEYGTYFENDYEGTYDLYDKKGNLILGGFSSFHFNSKHNLYYFNFLSNERINNWLVVDTNFKSIKKTDNRTYITLPKGYIIEEFDDDNLVKTEQTVTAKTAMLLQF